MNEWVDLKQILFYKNGKQVEPKSELYKILQNIRIPNHLTEIELRVQKFDEMDDNLIFVGKDSKNRKQYYYGKNHVAARTSNRINLLLDVYKRKTKVFKYIEKHLKSKTITMDYLFAVFLSIELKFYIRMGKEKYFKENNTIGLNTMTKKHIKINTKNIIFDFTGKVGVQQHFELSLQNTLAEHIIRIYNNPNNKTDYLFIDDGGKRLSENIIYDKMKDFKVKIKDLRTYGVNKIFIEEYIKAIKKEKIILKEKDYKKFIKEIVITTAKIIGHTPEICKSSYIVLELFEILFDPWFHEHRKELTLELVFARLKEFIEVNKYIEEPELTEDVKTKFETTE